MTDQLRPVSIRRLRLARFPTRALHIATLYALAVSAPLFHELAHEPKLFTSRQATPGSFLAFVAIVGLGPALVAIAVEAGAMLARPRFGDLLQLLIVAGLAALGAAQVVSGLPAPIAIVLALAFAAGFTAAYARVRRLRVALAVLAPLPLVVCALFFFDSSAARQVRGTHATPVVMVVFDEFTGSSLLDARDR